MRDIYIKRIGNCWDRWVLVQDPGSPFRRYWTGKTWSRDLRYARLYADLRFVLKDVGRAGIKRRTWQ